MKKIGLMIITMFAGLSLAQADLVQITNKAEVEAIKKAITDGLPNSDTLYCESVYAFNLYYFKNSQIKQISKVYRDLGNQPVLLLTLEEKTENSKIINSRLNYYFTTDTSGKKLLNMQVQGQYLVIDEIVNQGTIAQPNYKKMPPTWKSTVKTTCEFSN